MITLKYTKTRYIIIYIIVIFAICIIILFMNIYDDRVIKHHKRRQTKEYIFIMDRIKEYYYKNNRIPKDEKNLKKYILNNFPKSMDRIEKWNYIVTYDFTYVIWDNGKNKKIEIEKEYLLKYFKDNKERMVLITIINANRWIDPIPKKMTRYDYVVKVKRDVNNILLPITNNIDEDDALIIISLNPETILWRNR